MIFDINHFIFIKKSFFLCMDASVFFYTDDRGNLCSVATIDEPHTHTYYIIIYIYNYIYI